MKKELSKSAIVGTLVVAAVVVAIAAFVFFKPSLGSGPPLTPQKFTPPAGYDPNKAGGPIGAPANAGGESKPGN